VSAGRAPLATLPIAIALAAVAMASDHPLVIAACLLGSLLLLAAAPERPKGMLALGAVSGLSLAALNPFVGANGDLILVNGPHFTVLDLQVTVEEVGYGLAAGARLAAVTWLVAAALAIVDGDRLHAAVARVAPRSALTVALASRIVPVLRRDSRSIAEAARLRGITLSAPPRRAIVRRLGWLLLPLVTTSLERAVDQAQAMTVRGYGTARFTHLHEPRLLARERFACAVGVGLLVAGAAAIRMGTAPYTWYPHMGRLTGPSAVVTAGGLLLAAAACALALRPERDPAASTARALVEAPS
jgi:energy-coupling factor transporter transmembrane protein EcfT